MVSGRPSAAAAAICGELFNSSLALVVGSSG